MACRTSDEVVLFTKIKSWQAGVERARRVRKSRTLAEITPNLSFLAYLYSPQYKDTELRWTD